MSRQLFLRRHRRLGHNVGCQLLEIELFFRERFPQSGQRLGAVGPNRLLNHIVKKLLDESRAGFVAIRSLKKRGVAIVVREIPVPTDLLNILTAERFRRPCNTVLLWPLSRSRAWQLIKDVMRLAGIGPGIHATPPDSRYLCATRTKR